MNRLFWKAVLAFMMLPGIVAFAVPLWVVHPRAMSQITLPGGIVLAVGVVLLLWCVRDFYVAGRGTLAPWSPPERLVVVGLYRWSRNPMYVAVVIVIWGWALGYRSPPLAAYAVILMIAFHLRVILFEEPWLSRRHGVHWVRYHDSVPRWFGPVQRPRIPT